MDWLKLDEAIFYGAVWGTAFGASLFVTLGSNSVKSINRCFVLGGISGFLAFSIISFYVGRVDQPLSNHWYYLGIASAIGLSTQYQTQILTYVLKKLGIDLKNIAEGTLLDLPDEPGNDDERNSTL